MYRLLLLISTVFIQIYPVSAQKKQSVTSTTLNGLQLVFDNYSGSLLKMSHAVTGTIIETNADSAGLLDMAYPIKEFEPLRLSARFSKNAKITKEEGKITIHWNELGASRTKFGFAGKVSATVIFMADPDGKSVSLRCSVKNGTEFPIPQIIFPDFFGIRPFNGVKGTEFRTGGAAIKPFVDMVTGEEDVFFGGNKSLRRFHYGFVLDAKNLVIKWMDFGGRKSGLSLFSKDWGSNGGYNENVYLKLSELSQKLRYMHVLNTTIAPGSRWESVEYILTPHANGWAAGIETYRAWAQSNIKRLYPLPAHVRDGLGFRTVWMKSSFYDEDPKGIHFKFSDLPAVARESKAHGLDELNLWGWHENLWIPLPPPWKYVGTEAEMSKAVSDCKKEGVNVSPFLTFMRANNETSKKYGIAQNTSGYIYDTEFLPYMNPGYATAGNAAMVIQSNKQWQKDVITSTQHLIDLGITSFSWDQFFSDGSDRSLDTVVTEVLRMSKSVNPQSAFSGEVGTNMENECNYLDYSWNWDYMDDCDYSALINSLKGGPRINLNIDRSAMETKIGFADNLYLNVMPRKLDEINGSDNISGHAALSDALKQCARLRKQFLKYFVDGTFIGDCVLTKEIDGIHVSTYTLPESMLVIVVNKSTKGPVTLDGIITPWLGSSKKVYQVKEYTDGVLSGNITQTGVNWKQTIKGMKPLDIRIYELTVK